MADNGGGLTVKIPLVHLDGLLHPSVPPLLSSIPNVVPNGQEPGAPIFNTNVPAEPRSLLGRAGHGLLEGLKVAGIGVGTALDPNAMAMIPGTPEHALLQQAEQRKNELAQSQTAEEQAATERQHATASQISQVTPAEVAEMGAKTGLEDAQTAYGKHGAKGMWVTDASGKPAYLPESEVLEAPAGMYTPFKEPSTASAPHDAFHEWLGDPRKYTDFMKSMGSIKSGGKGAYGQFGPAFLAYHMLNQAYTENPALLPVLAPVIAKMFQSAGEPMSQAAMSTLETPPVGQPLSPVTGQPIGTLMPGSPTGQTRSRAQFALSGVLQELPAIKSEIGNLSGQLGPIEGRWNDFMAGKVGADDPKFSELRTSLKNIASAWMRLHANSEKALQDFENTLAGSKTAADLVANLNAIGRQAGNYYNQELGFGERGGATKATGNAVSWKDLK